MSQINTSSFNSDLLPGLIKKWFGTAYADQASYFDRMFEVVASNQQYEIHATLTPIGALKQKPQSQPLILDSSQETGVKPVYTNTTYALGFGITKEMLRDGTAFANAQRFVKQLKRGGMITKEIIAATFINNAASVTMTNGDGAALASASHPTFVGNQSNILSGGADLSEAAIEALRTQVRLTKDNRGLFIAINIKDLIVDPSQAPLAHRILNADGQSYTANLNNPNFLKDTNTIKSVIENPYLTSTTQWQVTTDCDAGLQFIMRQDLEVDTDNDFMTKQGLYSVDMRCTAGWDDFRGIYFSL